MYVRNILCVCTGNICRSPLAEGLLRRDAPSLTVASAGIGAVVGASMPAAAEHIARREGLDVLDHRARQLSGDLLRGADLVLVMESGQKSWIVSQFPESRGRVFMASHWRGGSDIPDPFRHDDTFFQQVFTQLTGCMDDWAGRLTRHAPV